MMSPGPLVCGVAAALATPWQLEGARLKRLLEPRPTRRVRGDPRMGVRYARAAVRVLSHIPFSPWRNTCLYRAVAGCLAVRWLGGAAVVRIGARRDPATGEIVAHAWIDGYPEEPLPDAGYRILARGTRAKW